MSDSYFIIVENQSITIQINTAIGIDIPAYSNLFNILGIIGEKCPMGTPMIMHRMTHTDKYF